MTEGSRSRRPWTAITALCPREGEHRRGPVAGQSAAGALWVSELMRAGQPAVRHNAQPRSPVNIGTTGSTLAHTAAGLGSAHGLGQVGYNVVRLLAGSNGQVCTEGAEARNVQAKSQQSDRVNQALLVSTPGSPGSRARAMENSSRRVRGSVSCGAGVSSVSKHHPEIDRAGCWYHWSVANSV